MSDGITPLGSSENPLDLTQLAGSILAAQGGPYATLAFDLAIIGADPLNPFAWIKFLYDFAQFLADLFSGVPHDAKTVGLGYQLTKTTDGLTQYVGLNLVDGGRQDRVISESTGPRSFEAIVAAIADAVLTVANQPPNNSIWQPITTTVPGLSWAFINVAPPPGAPYTSGVSFYAFNQPTPLSLAAYKAKYGWDQPTWSYISQYLSSGKAPTWRWWPGGAGSFAELNKLALDAVLTSFKQYLTDNPPPPSPPPPPPPPITPPPGDPADDEIGDLTGVVNYWGNALLDALGGLQTNPNPDPVTCTQVTTAAALITTSLDAIKSALSWSPGPGGSVVNITPLVDALTTLAADVAKLYNADPVTCAQITSAAATIADAIAKGGVGDLSAVVEQLKRMADELGPDTASDAKVKAMAQQLRDQGLLDPGLAQIILS